MARTTCGLAADLDPITGFERLLAAEVTCRDHLVAVAKLIAIVDRSHRRSGRYAGWSASDWTCADRGGLRAPTLERAGGGSAC
jgi:hypothetical protein